MPEYAKISRVLDMPAVLNLLKFRIWKSYEYTRIPNVSDIIHSIMSLYKLLSSYGDRDVF